MRLPVLIACLVALAAMVYGQYGIRLNSEDPRATALFLKKRPSPLTPGSVIPNIAT